MRPQDLLYEFETTPEAPAPAGAAAVSEAIAASQAAEPEPQPAGTPAEPVAAGEPPAEPTEEEMQDALREFIRDEFYAMQQGMGAPEPPPGIPGATPGPFAVGPGNGAPPGGFPGGTFDWSQVDPYDETFGQQLGQGIRQELLTIMGGFMAPIAGSMQAERERQQAEHGEQIVQDMIAAELAAGPDLTEGSKAQLYPLAESLMPAIEAKYGQHPRAAEWAIKQAADTLRAIEAEARNAGVAARDNALAGLPPPPPAEPQPAGAAAVVPAAAPSAPLSAGALAAKYGITGR